MSSPLLPLKDKPPEMVSQAIEPEIINAVTKEIWNVNKSRVYLS